jgi:hypothetical protein
MDSLFERERDAMSHKADERALLADVELLYTLYAEALDDGELARW